MNKIDVEANADLATGGDSRLVQRIEEALRKVDARKPFLVVDGKPYSYSELKDRSGRAIALFEELNLSMGDHVGISTRSPEDMATLLVSALRAGLGVIVLNPELSPHERRLAIDSAHLSHIFADRDIVAATDLPAALGVTVIEPEANRGSAGLMSKIFSRSKAAAPEDGLHAQLARLQPIAPLGTPNEESTGLMLFTSGTTSRPKVVQLTHRNLGAQLAAFDEVYDYDAESRILNPTPMHFTDGILHGPLAALLNTATLHRPRIFEITALDRLMLSIYRDRITHFIVVPAFLSLMDRMQGRFDDAFRTPDFRYIRSSGDRLPEPLWRSIEERFGVQVTNAYGMSETVCEAIFCGPKEGTYKLGTIGKPIGCEAAILGEDGEPVKTGETGLLHIRGDLVMKGYLGQPELTAETFTGDDWLNTGDYAVEDEDGFMTVIGRKKALIITSGINVQPQAVVDALLEHPDIGEAHVLGLPDKVFGEMVAAAVVPKSPDAKERLTKNAILAHCRTMLDPHKLPREIRVVDELPRNPAGKVLGNEVLELFIKPTGEGKWTSDEDLETQVLSIAASTFGIEQSQVKLSSEPQTTPGWDSLAHMTLVADIERSFDITLSARDVLSINRLEHLVSAVARHKKG